MQKKIIGYSILAIMAVVLFIMTGLSVGFYVAACIWGVSIVGTAIIVTAIFLIE